jgi:DNA replication protein DnaC
MSRSLGTVVASISIQLVITTNIAFKGSPRFFAGDATMTSALLDPLLHHARTVHIEGDSYRSATRK